MNGVEIARRRGDPTHGTHADQDVADGEEIVPLPTGPHDQLFMCPETIEVEDRALRRHLLEALVLGSSRKLMVLLPWVMLAGLL